MGTSERIFASLVASCCSQLYLTPARGFPRVPGAQAYTHSPTRCSYVDGHCAASDVQQQLAKCLATFPERAQDMGSKEMASSLGETLHFLICRIPRAQVLQKAVSAVSSNILTGINKAGQAFRR